MADRVDAELAKVEVLDAEGHVVRLGDLWKGHSALLVWLRHFG